MVNHPNKPIIAAIAAMSENRVIGKDNQLPWHLPADLKHFKAITTGHPILMGRKTFESIGKPLPNRTNIIITRNNNYHAPGCIVVTSIDEAIEQATLIDAKEIFIIGGAEVYQQLMPHIQQLYLTIIRHQFEGDTYFPEIDAAFTEVSRETHQADEVNPYAYDFIKLERQT